MGDAREPHDGLISGRYALGELLGTGGSASVFAAHDRETGRMVALKILHPHLSRSEATREAFFAEARAAEVLHHPNIGEVLGVGVHDTGDAPQAWIALEHAPGLSLAELVERDGRLPPGEALAVADGVLAALEFAHGAGLIHRDVSPANIMLARDPRGALRPSGVRLVDFGLADAAGRAAIGTDVLRTPDAPVGGAGDDAGPEAAATARPAGVLGNVNYVSPEQARGEPVDERGDIYQLGAVLYFALVGHAPFVRDSARAVMLAHLQAPPPVPSVARPGLQRAIDRIVVKALLKDPDMRFASAADMRTAVRSAATHLGPVPAAGSAGSGRGAKPAGGGRPGASAPGGGAGALAGGASGAGALAAGVVAGGRAGAFGAGAVAAPGGARPGGLPGTGAASGDQVRAAGADATQVMPMAGHGGGFESAVGRSDSGRSDAGDDAATAVLPTLRSRTSMPAGGSPRTSASGVRPGTGPASGAAASAASRPTGRAAPTTAPAAAAGIGSSLTARGSLGLWLVVGLAAVVVVVAWALAAGGSSPSTFAAGPPTSAPASTAPPTSAAAGPTVAAVTPTVAVPELANGSLAAARDALAAAGLSLGTISAENSLLVADTVLRADPVPGSAIPVGGTVNLVVASGSNLVPHVAGTLRADAQASLRGSGFEVIVSTKEDDAAPGTVLSVAPAEGTAAALGSTINLVVAAPRTPVATSTPTATPAPTPTSTPPASTPEPTAPGTGG
ncbi:PASTA domain-containing protein [Herbiconiux sp. 11R-BC]|uniref:protein kinase domain-containing protein n=1 Tax=Herbiconiux sp. 11R-BC TaxID=3111637 RepID=UPI003C0D10FB